MLKIRRRPPNPPIDVKSLRYQVNVPNAEPRHILEEIVWHKETEVANMREKMPLVELHRKIGLAPPPRNFLEALGKATKKPAVIAEIKKASPSKGLIREDFDPVAIARAYEQGGATCISVLTDEKFFQGSFENLALAREAVDLPLLCKEFIIYPYQIYRARLAGADAVLLIAAILSDRDLQYFVKIAKVLGMTALVEIHTLAELDRVLAIEGVSLLGINNRNLEDFSVDLERTCNLLKEREKVLRQKDILVVSESGLHLSADLSKVALSGAGAVLIGESLVKQADPKAALEKLLEDS